MKFTKMHGTGNDYIYVNGFEEKVSNPSKLSVKLSDRHFGIGADGLIIIMPSKVADVRMLMFNADGSEGEMCGNGIRCVGKYAYEHGIAKKEKMTVETTSGVKSLELFVKNGKVDSVTVDMGEAKVGKDAKITIDGRTFGYIPVDVGNPHAVIFIDEITDDLVLGTGPKIEKNFPGGVNVEFIKPKSKKELDFRVWERGSGETMACGTGACAAVAAGIAKGLLDKKVTVHLKGGDLEIELKNGHVFMTGNAVEVFSGEI
ncbi:MAG: diaminopimelate epimerase [Nanoarchaeota archaeon]|nr:MAG: diaminopimelate epimerase [Nanoarchaeota archaeon]